MPANENRNVARRHRVHPDTHHRGRAEATAAVLRGHRPLRWLDRLAPSSTRFVVKTGVFRTCRPKAFARFVLDVSARWVSPSSRGLCGGDALLPVSFARKHLVLQVGASWSPQNGLLLQSTAKKHSRCTGNRRARPPLGPTSSTPVASTRSRIQVKTPPPHPSQPSKQHAGLAGSATCCWDVV